MQFGVQTIPQGRSVHELRAMWEAVEEAGFHVISVPDHLTPIRSAPDAVLLEATALHLLLAMSTERVECGALVYCAPFRPVGVLARSLAVISEVSGGRCFAGLGAGWWPADFEMWGLPFRSAGERSDELAEVTTALRGLLRGETVSLAGRYVQLNDARCAVPDGRSVPIWVAGNGERRTLPTAARSADGWNSPFTGPAELALRNRRLDELCEQEEREPGSLRRSVNVRLAWDDETLAAIKADMRPGAHDGILCGSVEEIRDRVGDYGTAGADLLMIDVRDPQPAEDLLRFAQEVVTA